jgi:hypothetical protein
VPDSLARARTSFGVTILAASPSRSVFGLADRTRVVCVAVRLGSDGLTLGYAVAGGTVTEDA